MEKHEKIAKSRLARFRVLASVLVVVGICILGRVFFRRRSELHPKMTVVNWHDTPVADSTPQLPSEEELVEQVNNLDAKVREIKATGVMMEVDPEGLEASKALQDATRKLLAKRYGTLEPYHVKLDLEFQESMPDFEKNGAHGEVVIEMAPSELVPHSIFSFLEIARNWNAGAFHRNANHVLQTFVKKSPVRHLAFQEYSKEWPHKKGTVGYAGRPSGPAWYISILDNTKNHGPGTQQKKNPYEADSCFGRVIEGFQSVVLDRITKMPGHEFINDPKKHVIIKTMTIMVPSNEGSSDYVEWKET